MTENIGNYSFDFEKEVNALRQFLGAAAGNLIFVDVGIDPQNPKEYERAFARQIIAGDEAFFDRDMKYELESNDIQEYARYPAMSSMARKILDWDRLEAETGPLIRDIHSTSVGPGYIKGYKIFLNENDFNSGLLGTKSDQMWKLFGLYHETAHGLTDKGDLHSFKQPAENENLADAYAALLLLKRFGQQAVPFLQTLSWMRAAAAFKSPSANHLTSPLLDKIVFDSRHEDFSTLTSAQAMKKAIDYTVAWTPERAAFKKVEETAEHFHYAKPGEDPVGWLLAMPDRSGYAPENLAFYVAVKNAFSTLHPEMKGGSSYKPYPLDDEQARRIVNHASGMTLSSLFNRGALKATGTEKPAPASPAAPRTASANGVQP